MNFVNEGCFKTKSEEDKEICEDLSMTQALNENKKETTANEWQCKYLL